MFGAEQDQERSTEEEEESPLQRQVENLFGSTGVLPWLEVTSRSSESGSNRGDNRPSEASLFLAMANAAAQRGGNALPSATEERVQRLLQHQLDPYIPVENGVAANTARRIIRDLRSFYPRRRLKQKKEK